MKYKYLLFDADDTLLDFKEAEKSAFYKMLKEVGIEPTPLLHQRYSEINQSVWERFEKGIVTKDEIGYLRYFEFVKDRNLNVDPSLLDSTYHRLLGLEGGIFENADKVCSELCDRGYIISIVTNGYADTQKSRMSLSGLNPYISKLYISEELGVQKPETEFFNKVFEDIGCFDKEKYLIIGDSLTSDILGGKNAGIDTCRFNPRNKPESDVIIPDYSINTLEELLTFL